MSAASNDLQAWIGRSETVRDRIGATPVDALNATLDHEAPRAAEGDALPPLWHWLYFLPLHRQSEIGPDGHARRGGFLPPVELDRRRVEHVVRQPGLLAQLTLGRGRQRDVVGLDVPPELEPQAGTPVVGEQHLRGVAGDHEHARGQVVGAAGPQVPVGVGPQVLDVRRPQALLPLVGCLPGEQGGQRGCVAGAHRSGSSAPGGSM